MSGNNKNVTTDKWATVTSENIPPPGGKRDPPGRKRANTGKRRVIVSSEENGKSKHSQLPTTMNGKKRKPTLDRRLKVGQKGGQEPRGTFSQAAIAELNGRLS